MKNSVLEFRKNFPGKKMTEKPELEKNAYGDVIEPPIFEDSEHAMKELKEDPRFMVVLHEKQLENMANVIEEIAQRLISLEAKVIELETTTRFPSDSPLPNLSIGSEL